jgi:hypothetical protein
MRFAEVSLWKSFQMKYLGRVLDKIAVPAVAVIVFNRPEVAAQMLKAVEQAKPKKLYVIVDGPREHYPDDLLKVQQVLDLVNSIKWDCEVLINKSETNLGLSKRIVSGIDWVFETETKAIILEDDCVGNQDFFRFCAEMLEKYADDPRVGSVSGSYLGIKPSGPANSYHFNSYSYIWGWATWARAWKDFEQREAEWRELSPASKAQLFRDSVPFFWQRMFWKRLVRTKPFEELWDFQWVVTQWINSRLSVEPNVNLVRNVGFGQGATHTKESGDILGMVPVGNLSFPLEHPTVVSRDLAAMRSIVRLFRASNLSRHSKLLSRMALRILGLNGRQL